MSDDLDEFLRQAAQRRQQRQQQKNARPSNANSPSQQSNAPAPRPKQNQRPLVPTIAPLDVPVAEIIDDGPTPSVGNLEPSIVKRSVESDIDRYDDRMAAHLKDTFQHELSHFKRPTVPDAPNVIADPKNISSSAPQVQDQTKAMVSSADLKVQLRNPQTLRLAIIAHEIMKRPW